MAPDTVRCSDLLDDLGCKRLEHKRASQLANFMLKIVNNISPSYLRRIFANVSYVCFYNLRNSSITLYILRGFSTEDMHSGTISLLREYGRAALIPLNRTL